MSKKDWYVKPLKGELKINNGGTKIIICPDKKHAGKLKDIDVIYLELENAKGEVRHFWGTPDEMAEIASSLSMAVSAWLNFKFEPYMKKFNKRRNELSKN